MEGSAVVVVAVCDLSHEHLSPDFNATATPWILSATFWFGFGVSVGVVCSLAQHGFRFVFVAFSSSSVAMGFGAGVGSAAGSGFEQQQPFVTFSITGQAQDAGGHPALPPLTIGHVAARAGITTVGVNWPKKAKTARVNRKVTILVNNAESRNTMVM